MKHQELILAVDADLFKDCGEFTEISLSDHPERLSYRQRAFLESTSDYRQIIPYVILRHDNKLLVCTRTREGGEPGLYDKATIGFAGHCDLADAVEHNGSLFLEATISKTIMRELKEEFNLSNSHFKSFRTLRSKLVSSDNDVDSRHLALIVVADVKTKDIKPAEPTMEIKGWYALEDIPRDCLESWSLKIVNSFIRLQETRLPVNG